MAHAVRVEFDPRPFRNSHGCAPRGRGSWAFALAERPAEVMFSPGSMLKREAEAWARAKVRAMDIPAGVAVVSVLVLP
ncbi:MAG: hypothetical protein JWP57_4422 [Spirosoma sp.]|nr:hypothetical protein [Spirosoma sp.]